MQEDSSIVVVDFGVVGDDRFGVVDPEHPDEGLDDRLVAYPHQVGECFAKVLGRQLEMVVGYLGEQMVDLVRADAVDEVMDRPVVAVDGRQLALDELPLLVRVPGDVELGMLEEGDDDAVAAEKKVWHDIVVEEAPESDLEIKMEQGIGHDSHAGQGQETAKHMPCKHGMEGLEVADGPGVIAL